MGGGYNEASVVPNTEGLQEVRVISNNFTAEYGRGQAVISMSTKSGTNRFTGQARLHGPPRGGSTPTRSRTTPSGSRSGRSASRPRRHRSAARSCANKLFFFTSYHQLRHNNTQTMLHDGADGARARRRLQPDARSRTRAASRSRRASSIRSTSSRKGPDLYRRRRDPERAHPEPGPGRAADVQLLPAAEPHAGRRLQHQQLRGDDRPDGPPLQLEQPRRLPHRPAFDLRQRRHLLRRDHHAAAVRRSRRSTAPTASAATRTRSCRSATRSCSARRCCSTCATASAASTRRT